MNYKAAMEIAKQKAEINADNRLGRPDDPSRRAYVFEETHRIYMQMVTPPQKSERQLLEEISGKLTDLLTRFTRKE